MVKPVNFRTELAESKQDNSLWTARDALEDMIRRIDAGEINPEKMAIHWLEAKGTKFEHQYCLAKLTYADHIALLHLAVKQTIDEWAV